MRYIFLGLSLFLIANGLWAGTFLDDFEDGNLNGWIPMAFGDPGEYKIEKGELILQSGSPGDYIIYMGNDSWDDYIIEAKVKIPASAGVGFAGFVFRVNGAGSYTAALANGKEIASYKFKFSGPSNYRTLPFKYEPDTWYNLKAIISGDQFQYFVNDELVMEYNDSEHAVGGVGLQASIGSAYFDDFMVTGDNVPGNVTAVSPKNKLAVKWGEIR